MFARLAQGFSQNVQYKKELENLEQDGALLQTAVTEQLQIYMDSLQRLEEEVGIEYERAESVEKPSLEEKTPDNEIVRVASMPA